MKPSTRAPVLNHHFSAMPLYRVFVLLLFLSLAAPVWAAAEPTRFETAVGLFQGKKYPEAQAAFEKIAAAEPKNAEAAYYLGQLALRRSNQEQAVQWLEKATQLALEKSSYFNALGDAYGLSAQKAGIFSKMGFAKKCLAAYDKAVALDPDNLEARENRVGFYREAPGLVGGGMDKAYAEAAEIQKRDWMRGSSLLISLHVSQKKRPEAYALAEEIRKRDWARGAQILGDLYVDDKKFTEAFALLDEAEARYPDKQVLLYQAGRLAALSGQQLDRGEAALKKYLGYTPANGEPGIFAAHWRLGDIYAKKGDKTAARAEYEASLKLRPGFKPAQDALNNLKP
jgi:tetratricopeptide (TPR) repeat protein